MNRKIYLHTSDGQLQPLEEASFAAEDDLQTLLESYPELLAGDQFDDKHPRRWMLISREAAVPDREDGAGRWSLDHLFLDQDGIPTLVEVKRSSDTRIRREVVGQMLDYAANGVTYWPVETLRADFEATYEDHAERVALLLGHDEVDDTDDVDIDTFWQTVKTNLQAGRIRMLFVADSIPRELARIVEFLNEQMDPAEVLAVAVRRYVGGDLQTLVPQVVGQTAQAEKRKSTGGSRQTREWDPESFLTELGSRSNLDEVAAAKNLFGWAEQRDLRIRWGKGGTYGSWAPFLDLPNGPATPVLLWTNGVIEFQFQYMKTKNVRPFVETQQRLDLIARLNEIAGVEIQPEKVDLRPGVPLAIFGDPDRLNHLIEILDWFFKKVREAQKAP